MEITRIRFVFEDGTVAIPGLPVVEFPIGQASFIPQVGDFISVNGAARPIKSRTVQFEDDIMAVYFVC